MRAINTYITLAGGAQARGGRGELVDSMTRALQAHWYPTIRDLNAAEASDIYHAASPKVVEPLKRWIELGRTLGLELEQQKELYDRRMAQMCAWRDCQYHQTKPPTPTRVCAGCGEVRYCSRECQKRRV